MVKGAIAGQAIGAIGQAVGSMFNMIGQVSTADALRAQSAAQKYQARRSLEGMRHQTIGQRLGEQIQRLTQQDVLAHERAMKETDRLDTRDRAVLEDKRVLRDLALQQFAEERKREQEKEDYWGKSRREAHEQWKRRHQEMQELQWQFQMERMKRMRQAQLDQAEKARAQREAFERFKAQQVLGINPMMTGIHQQRPPQHQPNPYANYYHPQEWQNIRNQRQQEAQYQEHLFRQLESQPTVRRVRSY